MNRAKGARLTMSAVLIAGAISSFILDWRANHLLNPDWHPHAKFHGALLLFFLSGVSATGLWLLWRQSKEPEVALKAAAFISLSFWTPLFYIPFLLPTSTWWAGTAGAEPRLAGYIVYPNLLVAGVFLLLTIGSYWVARRGPSVPQR